MSNNQSFMSKKYTRSKGQIAKIEPRLGIDQEQFQQLVSALKGSNSSGQSSADYWKDIYNTAAGNEVMDDETGLLSWWNSKTGRGLTRAEIANNAFAAQQAATTRDWQTNLANTEVQRRVADMSAAGVNPALMYGNSSSGASTPSGATASPSFGSTGSFQDLVGALMLPLQMRMLKAQIKNTEVKTEGEGLRNQYQSLVNGYYPTLTEETINQIRTHILGEKADINLKEAQASMQKVQTALEAAKLQYKDEYARLQRDFMEAQTNSQKAAAAAALARAAMDNCEAAYMKANNMRMGSNDYVALAEAICGWLGTSSGEVVQSVVDTVVENAPKVAKDLKDDFSAPFSGKFGEGMNPKVKRFFQHGYDKAKGFVNKRIRRR